MSTIAAGFFARYRYPDWLRRHSLAVGRIAARIALAQQARGTAVDVRAATLGAYLHDIGKTPLLSGDRRAHEALGPLVLAAEGLSDLAELARRHPVYAPRDPATGPRTLEEKIVYYADRRAGQEVVSLEERIDEQLARFPQLAATRAADLDSAKRIEAELFAGLPFGPVDLAELGDLR